MKIATERLKEIIKEEVQSVVEGEYGPARPGWPEGDSRDASSKAKVDAEGAKEAFVVSDLYWLRLLLKMLTKSEKVNMSMLPKYTNDVVQAIDSIDRWNHSSDDQKERTGRTERDLDKHWSALGVGARPQHRQQEAFARWLPFHKGFNRALEDLERGMFDQADADAAEKYTLHVSNDLGHQAVLDDLDKSDPTGTLRRFIRSGNSILGPQRFNRRKAARNAAPWLKQILEPVRRGLKYVGLAEIIDEELEAILSEKGRTSKGNITQKTREKHATVGKDKFPIFDKKSAVAAIDLRGHASQANQKKIINKAAKYAPKAAKKARRAEKKEKK